MEDIVARIFQGIAVIFDDEIYTEDSGIYNIKTYLEAKGIMVACYNYAPDVRFLPAVTNASFVIVDWDYTSILRELNNGADDYVPISNSLELSKTTQEGLIAFLLELLNKTFIPVFIFTGKNVDEIRSEIKDKCDGILDKRIFIKSKDELGSPKQLFNVLENWIKEMPSVYVLKEWDKTITQSKHSLFLNLYSCSPAWPKVIKEMLQRDSCIGWQHEFGEFLTKSLSNRIDEYTFNESFIDTVSPVDTKDIQKVLEGERYYEYPKEKRSSISCTGDLYKINDDYFLNIGAQCDLSIRPNTGKGEYNPDIYCLKGQVLKRKEFTTKYISISDDGLDIDGKKYSFKEISKLEKRDEINANLKKHRDKTFFRKGTFLDKDDKIIIGCVANEQAIQFKANLQIKKFKDIQEYLIGRILPPYITRIQQRCSQYLIREGILPIPEELLDEN